jgi:DNA-binding beta-propeller fold protein YncE
MPQRQCTGRDHLAFGFFVLGALAWPLSVEAQERFALKRERHPDRVAFSPDGKRLAVSWDDYTVRIVDVATAKEALELKSPRQGFADIAFSPDGASLATATSAVEPEAVMVWDLATGKPRGTLPKKDGPRRVAYSPDGKLLATDTQEFAVRLWDARTLKEVGTLEGANNRFFSLSFSADGRMLIAGTPNAALVWDLSTRKLRSKLPRDNGEARYAALSPDGKTLATVGGYPQDAERLVTVGFSDPAKDELRSALKPERVLVSVRGLAFSPSGKSVIVADAAVVQIIDIATGKTRSVLEGHRDFLLSMALSPDGKLLATSALDKTVRVWNVPPEE